MANQNFGWKKVVADYFTFAKFQRRAIVVFIAGILLLCVAPAVWQFLMGTKTEKADPITLSEVTELKARPEEPGEGNYYKKPNDYTASQGPEKENYSSKHATGELFAFDPNTATVAEWKRLGIRDKTAATILNYLSKGGHFYKPEDLAKIYGLHKDEVDRLTPYVRIAGKEKPDYKNDGNDAASYTKPAYTKTAYTLKTVDVNMADTSAFIALPGIGSKLAARIVNYRDKLGGFYSINQIGETFGLADSVFQQLKPRLTLSGTVRKINVNTATAAELKMPYLPYNVVNAIVQYRGQHGHFKSVDEIKKVMLVDESLYTKVAPYLKTE